MKEKEKEPVLVSSEDLETVKSVLADALKSRGVSNPESLSLDSLAAQFDSDGDREEAADTLSQQQIPLTGGESSADLANAPRSGSIEAAARSLSPKQAADVDQQLKLAEALESRGIDKRAGEIRAEIAEDVGVEPSEVESLGRREWSRLTEAA